MSGHLTAGGVPVYRDSAGVVRELKGAAELDALRDAIPQPATHMPPGVADASSAGDEPGFYALANHTHASKARKQIVSMPSAAATYRWTYPVPFAVGVVPVCNAIVQVPAGTTDLLNVQVVGAPDHLGVTLQINRVTAGLLAMLTGALSINPTPIRATLHLLALEP